MRLRGFREVNKGVIKLASQANTTLTNQNEYYPVLGTFSDGILKSFILAADGNLTYLGGNATFLLNGVSDVACSGTALITYGLFKNGTLITGAETPHNFSAQDTIENISIANFIQLNTGDVLQVRAKSSVAGRTITVSTLRVTFWGEK